MKKLSRKTKVWARMSFIAFALILCWTISSSLRKLPNELQTGTEFGEYVFPPICERDVRVTAHPVAAGFMVIGAPVQLKQSYARYIINQPRSEGDCNTTIRDFKGPFGWEITLKPKGSNAKLNNPDSPVPTFTPDKSGTYRIEMKTCPEGCRFLFFEEPWFNVGPQTYELEIEVSDESVIPPSTMPQKPVHAATPRTRFDKGCEGGIVNPQWRTVEQWSGPQDYKLVEGDVVWSNISRVDNPLNHHTQDFNFSINPDSVFHYLLAEDANRKGRIEVEWESRSFPEYYRPTKGDRVSVIGYWIRDCGHVPNNTEIHPPLMVATHRARPVQLEDYGINVYVPGVITSIWINRDAGETTGNCSQTGLHQPFDVSIPNVFNTCLPQTAGFSKNPINRNFSFKIYLPENPRKIYESVGLQPPPQVPLHVKLTPPEPEDNKPIGPEPQITKYIEEGYIEVNVDLSNFSGDTYNWKIESAWVLPSPSNWGLKAWRVAINMLDVHNDSDGFWGGDGDWRFWANLNNREQEWTKMYDCDGCVHGRIDYGDNPWSTGIPGERSLGPDVWLFPTEDLWVHTSGFEDDLISSDNTGHVDALLNPGHYIVAITSECEDGELQSNCGQYTLHFGVSAGEPLPAPTLNDEAKRIYDSYKLVRSITQDVAFPEAKFKTWYHPITDGDFQDSIEIALYDDRFFSDQRAESGSLAGISNEDFAAQLTALKANNPEAYETFIKELKEEFDEYFDRENKDEVYGALERVKTAMPQEIWEENFSYIKFPSTSWIPGLSNGLVIALAVILLLLIFFFTFRRKQ